MNADRPPRRSMMSKVVRFPVIGLLNTLVYSVATSAYISNLHVASQVAACLGYLTALPIAFFAHRSFTFGSNGVFTAAMGRFGAVHAIGMLVSWLAMKVTVDYFGWHYITGIIGAVVLVPVLSFLALDRWVFPPDDQSGPQH